MNPKVNPCCADFSDAWQLGIIGWSRDNQVLQLIRPKHVDETNSLCGVTRMNIRFCPFCGKEFNLEESV
jgi:hypothetical protein